MSYRNHHFVSFAGAIAAALLLTDTAGSLLMGREDFAFRAWEAVRAQGAAAPFEPLAAYEATIHGDLANLLKVSKLRRPRHQRFTTDRFGFRNPVQPEGTHHPVVVVGDSDMAGSSLSDDETFGHRLSARLGVPVYNYAPRSPLDFLADPRFAHDPPKILIWEALEQTLAVRRTAPQGAGERAPLTPLAALDDVVGSPRSPKLTQHHAAWLFNDIRWALIGAAPYLEASVAHVAPDTGMMFYQPAVQLLRRSAQERGLDQIVRDIRRVAALCRQRGIELVFVALPNKETVYVRSLPASLRPARETGYLAALADRLDRHAVTNVPLHRTFEEAAAGAMLYLLDDTHWSPEGVRLAVDATVETIADAGLLR